MMNSNLNLSALPECKFAYQMVNSALLIPCAEYQRVLHVEKVAHIAENFSEYEGEYSRKRRYRHQSPSPRRKRKLSRPAMRHQVFFRAYRVINGTCPKKTRPD